MKQGFLLLFVVVLAQATNLQDTQWEQFKARYMKDYEPEEESTRKTIWTNNHAFIKRHNEAYEAGNETYAVGENEYTDLTNMEFASMLTSMQGFKSLHAGQHTCELHVCEIGVLVLSHRIGLVPCLIRLVVSLDEGMVVGPDGLPGGLLFWFIVLHIPGLELLPLSVLKLGGLCQDHHTQ